MAATTKKGGPRPPFENYAFRFYCFDARMAMLSPPPISHATKMMHAKPNTALAVKPQQDF
jgi:hypothetical protein